MDRVEALARGAEAARISGDYEAAKTLCLEALDRFDHGDDPGRAARLYERLGRYHFHRFDSALAAYIEAQRLLPEGRTAQRARLLGDEALTLSFMARFDEVRDRAARRSRSRERRRPPRRRAPRAWSSGSRSPSWATRVAASASCARGCGWPEAGNTEDIGRGYMDLAEVMRIQGRFDVALEVAREGEEVVSRFGAQDPTAASWPSTSPRTSCAWGAGRRRASRSTSSAAAGSGRPGRLLDESVVSRLEAARGRFEEADAGFERVRELIQSGGPAETCRDLRRVGRGDPLARRPESARGASARASRRSATRSTRSTRPSFYNVGARAEADAGRTPPRSPRSCSRGSRTSGSSTASAGSSPRSAGAPGELPREVARAKGEPSAELWAEAASAWQRVGQPYPAAYAAWREGEARLLDDASAPRRASRCAPRRRPPAARGRTAAPAR